MAAAVSQQQQRPSAGADGTNLHASCASRRAAAPPAPPAAAAAALPGLGEQSPVRLLQPVIRPGGAETRNFQRAHCVGGLAGDDAPRSGRAATTAARVWCMAPAADVRRCTTLRRCTLHGHLCKVTPAGFLRPARSVQAAVNSACTPRSHPCPTPKRGGKRWWREQCHEYYHGNAFMAFQPQMVTVTVTCCHAAAKAAVHSTPVPRRMPDTPP